MLPKQECINKLVNTYGVCPSVVTGVYQTKKAHLEAIVTQLLQTDEEHKSQWLLVRDSISNLTESDLEFLSTFTPDSCKGFMFTENDTLAKIERRVITGCPLHSGSSYGWTMRWVECALSAISDTPVSDIATI